MSRRRITLAQMKFTTEFGSAENLALFARKLKSGSFFFCSASTVARASSDEDLARELSLGYAIPDSTPLAFTLTRNRKIVIRGTSFTRQFCESSISGEKIFFVGSTDAVLKSLELKLAALNPHLNIVGMHSPSFHDSILDKVQITLEMVEKCGPEFIFVALSSPQQDYFIAELSKRYPAKYFAVGAAFEFIAESKLEAPQWLQGTGLEWIFRLIHEPRRLWRRYLIDNTLFILLSLEYFLTRKLRRSRNGQ